MAYNLFNVNYLDAITCETTIARADCDTIGGAAVNTPTTVDTQTVEPSHESTADHAADNETVNTPRGADNIIRKPAFNIKGIHKKLQVLNQWMLANGKVPSRAINGKLYNANAHDQQNWLSFDRAVACADALHCGISIVLNNSASKLCGVDIDHCIDEHGNFTQLANDFIIQFDGRAYIEKSLSGTGLHFYFFDNDAPPIGTKQAYPDGQAVEVYSYKRALVVTGNAVNNIHTDNIQFDGGINMMLKFLGKTDKNIERNVIKDAHSDGKLTEYLSRYKGKSGVKDDIVINQIRRSKAVSKFSKLFDRGDLSDFNGDHSRADFALCKILAFFTHNNADQIERIFSQSKLCREKWAERSDYRDCTIAAAILANSKLKSKTPRADFEYNILKQLRCTRNGTPIPCVSNFDIVFDFDIEIRNILAYNLFSQQIELTRVPLWYSTLQRQLAADRAGFTPTLGYVDGDDAALQNYIDRTYDLRGETVFRRIVVERANQNMIHPVQDFFRALPPWDGTKRAERLFIDHLHANDDEYTRTVTMKWLLAAVARVFQRGCKFDYAIVLKGKQGIGKSTILSMLGGKWFGELDSIQGKDAVENIQGKWIIELTEMQAAKKAENEAIKAFLSRGTDHVRLPYARRSQPFPRQCVFAATTNDSEILRDQTGGRRFWFIECNAVDFDVKITHEDITQIWAEVFHSYNELFADGFDSGKLDLPNHLKAVARELQSANTDGSDIRGLIEAFLERPFPRYEFWRLLSKDERQQYYRAGCAFLPFTRIKSANGRLGCSLADVENNCIEVDGKKLLPLDGLGDKSYDNIDRSFIFGGGKRQKVSPVEILNECFDGERSRLVTTRKIADIMRTLDGWQYSRGAVNDPHYGRQDCSFIRVDTPTADHKPVKPFDGIVEMPSRSDPIDPDRPFDAFPRPDGKHVDEDSDIEFVEEVDIPF